MEPGPNPEFTKTEIDKKNLDENVVRKNENHK